MTDMITMEYMLLFYNCGTRMKCPGMGWIRLEFIVSASNNMVQDIRHITISTT
jgi:hypothetical protein